MMSKLDAFTRQYIETALWSSTDNADDSGGEPLDKNYSSDDIDPATMEQMIADCASFQEKFAELLSESGIEDGRAGHDFWLSRNGHGSGYFDEDTIDEEFQEKLQDAAESYGNVDLQVDDGVISDGIHWTPAGTNEARRRPMVAARRPTDRLAPGSMMTAGGVLMLAGELSKKVGGTTPKYIEGGFRWSEPNESAQFTTYSPEHGQKVVVVVSIFSGSTALGFFSNEGLSETDRYENISSFTYGEKSLNEVVTVKEMVKDVEWVWETVDGYAESWGAGQDDEMDEVRRGVAASSSKAPIRRWMLANVDRFIDRRTGEIDCTSMVETWDNETQNGGVTTDPDHIAWDVAVEVANETHHKMREVRPRARGMRAAPSADEVAEMIEIMERYGYSAEDARKLSAEGMGPMELEHILRTTKPGGMGSLEYTRRIHKVASGVHSPAPHVAPPASSKPRRKPPATRRGATPKARRRGR